MSKTTSLPLDSYQVHDFLSIDHGTEKITIRIFKGRRDADNSMFMLTPDQAEILSKVLIAQAKDMRLINEIFEGDK